MMSDFKNELEQEVEFINDLISRYLPDETGLDKKIREATKSPDQVLFITGMFPSGKRANYAVDLTQE